MQMDVNAGAINVSVYFSITGDASHANPGDPITGLLFSDIETGGSASYMRQGGLRADFALITLAAVDSVHADGGFIEVDATNMPGVYRCDYPDAAFAGGIDLAICQLVAAAANNANIAPNLINIIGGNPMLEAYAAKGATMTVPEGIYEIISLLGEKAISSTTQTHNKRDGTTVAGTSTLDDPSNPTAITRAT